MRDANGRAVNDLPAVVGVAVQQVKYDPPRQFYLGPELKQVTRAVELLVRTSASLPVLDLPPVLFIGQTIIPDYEIAVRISIVFCL